LPRWGTAPGPGIRASHLALFDQPNVPDIHEHLLAQDVIWVDLGRGVVVPLRLGEHMLTTIATILGLDRPPATLPVRPSAAAWLGRGTTEHDPWPWLDFFAVLLDRAYERLERGVCSTRSTCPRSATPPSGSSLETLKTQGLITADGTGRSAGMPITDTIPETAGFSAIFGRNGG
jgi:hypothetical protein